MTLEDLRPKPKVKLANFEIEGGTVGWIAPEYALYPDMLTAPSDVFSLGLVFAFLLSKGTHPFGAPHVRQSNILFGSYHLSEEKLNDPSAVDLIKRMLDPDSDTRITVEGVLDHPYFWSGDRALSFVIRAVDEVIKPEMKKAENGEQSAILEELTKEERPIVRGYWKEYLTPCIRRLMDRKSYDARTLTGLLLAIRDKVCKISPIFLFTKRTYHATICFHVSCQSLVFSGGALRRSVGRSKGWIREQTRFLLDLLVGTVPHASRSHLENSRRQAWIKSPSNN